MINHNKKYKGLPALHQYNDSKTKRKEQRKINHKKIEDY